MNDDPIPEPQRRDRRRVALVTGATSGIGEATAIELASAGFDLILVARRKEALEHLARELAEQHGVDADVIAADLSTDEGIEQVIAETRTVPIGTAVLAAGFGSAGGVLDADLDRQRQMVRVNCEAPLAIATAVAAGMAERGDGQIVLFSSVVAFQGAGGSANYAATKAYIQSLAEGLAIDLRPHGVNVLAVAPGPVDSGFGDEAAMDVSNGADPAVVARSILRSLGRSGTLRPGGLSKLLGFGLSMLPRRVRTFILTRVMASMSHGPT